MRTYKQEGRSKTHQTVSFFWRSIASKIPAEIGLHCISYLGWYAHRWVCRRAFALPVGECRELDIFSRRSPGGPRSIYPTELEGKWSPANTVTSDGPLQQNTPSRWDPPDPRPLRWVFTTTPARTPPGTSPCFSGRQRRKWLLKWRGSIFLYHDQLSDDKFAVLIIRGHFSFLHNPRRQFS